MYIANAGTSRYIKVRMNICTGGTASANICEEYLHWLLLLEEGSLGLLPLQRLHALQVAGHQDAAVPSLSQASFLGLGEVFAVGCAGGSLDHGGLLLDFLGLKLVGHVELCVGVLRVVFDLT